MSVDYALQKQAGEAARGFDKVAVELDMIATRIAGLENQIWQCNVRSWA